MGERATANKYMKLAAHRDLLTANVKATLHLDAAANGNNSFHLGIDAALKAITAILIEANGASMSHLGIVDALKTIREFLLANVQVTEHLDATAKTQHAADLGIEEALKAITAMKKEPDPETAAEAKLRAERRAGELLAETVKHGGDQSSRVEPCLADLGIDKKQSHRWQAIATGINSRTDPRIDPGPAAGQLLVPSIP